MAPRIFAAIIQGLHAGGSCTEPAENSREEFQPRKYDFEKNEWVSVGGGWAPTSWRRRRGRSAMDVRRRARGVWTTRSILPRRPRLVQFPGVRGVTALVWVGVPDNEPEGAVEVCVGSVPGQLQGDAVQGGNAAKHNGEETPHRLLLRARHGGVRGGRRWSWLRTTRWAKYLVHSRGHRASKPVFTTTVCK